MIIPSHIRPALRMHVDIMMPCIALIAFIFSAVSSPCWALQLRLPETSYQGDLIVGKIQPPAPVHVGGKMIPVSPEGYFVIGIPRLQKKDLSVWTKAGNKKIFKIIRVLAYRWNIQRIDGLPDQYVNPSPENLKRIRNDSQTIQAIRRAKPYPVPLFLKHGFGLPVKGRITGVFGSQRILNGHPRSPHQGVDFAAPLNASVYSPADGTVRLVGRNMYLMGNMIMIDHGLGVQSIFIHLNSITVKKGDQVHRGDIIGRVGKTGRATGPHLHWGVSVGTVPVDPARLTGKNIWIP